MTRLPAALCLVFLVGSISPASGVDVPDPPPEYLERTIRPEWRLAELDDVLAEIAEIIERPITPSDAVEEWEHGVILIEEDKLTILETLTILEETQGLHFKAEPLRLVASSAKELRGKKRNLVNLNLRDYGLFFQPQDHSVSVWSPDEADDGASPFDFGGAAEELPFEIEGLVSMLKSDTELDGSSTELRGRGNLMVLATPEEESALRSVLDRLYAIISRRSMWRVHFGLLPRDVDTRGGVVPTEEARALATQLDETEIVELSAANGQLVSGGQQQLLDVVPDAEVNQTGRIPVLNPVLNRIQAGRTVDLRPFVGLDHTLLIFDTSWLDPVGELRRETLRRPPTINPPQTVNNSTVRDADGKTQVRQELGLEPARVEPGLTIDLERQSVWRWQPRGEAFIPRDHALVLVGFRDGRRAVIIFEEVK